jgi:hypothetical protein
MHSQNDPDRSKAETFTGRDILYRESAVGLLDVQRAADALLRQGRKPSVAAIREHLGGGSPNTITPLLAKYWEKLGSRLGDGAESLERVPEALARVTELLWRRALEEARERLKRLQSPETPATGMQELQEQIGKLSIALAEARAREGEQLTHLTSLSKERVGWRAERASLLVLLKSTQSLLQQSNARVEKRQQFKPRRSGSSRLRKERAGGYSARMTKGLASGLRRERKSGAESKKLRKRRSTMRVGTARVRR